MLHTKTEVDSLPKGLRCAYKALPVHPNNRLGQALSGLRNSPPSSG